MAAFFRSLIVTVDMLLPFWARHLLFISATGSQPVKIYRDAGKAGGLGKALLSRGALQAQFASAQRP